MPYLSRSEAQVLYCARNRYRQGRAAVFSVARQMAYTPCLTSGLAVKMRPAARQTLGDVLMQSRHIHTELPGPKARALLERDRSVSSPSYPRDYPFVMAKGRGCEVWDVDGNRFLDFAAGIAVCSTGHSHQAVVKAIQEQAEKFIHISSDFYHEKWVQLGEKLDEIAPFKEDGLCFMANSGAEAVEAAIKLAR